MRVGVFSLREPNKRQITCRRIQNLEQELWAPFGSYVWFKVILGLRQCLRSQRNKTEHFQNIGAKRFKMVHIASVRGL